MNHSRNTTSTSSSRLSPASNPAFFAFSLAFFFTFFLDFDVSSSPSLLLSSPAESSPLVLFSLLISALASSERYDASSLVLSSENANLKCYQYRY